MTLLSCSIEFVPFFSSPLSKNCTNVLKLTKELSENACKKIQVARNIVGRAENSLKKLHTQKKYHISNSIKNGLIWRQNYTKEADGKKKKE